MNSKSEQNKTYRKQIGPCHFGTIIGCNRFSNADDLKKEIEEGFIKQNNNYCQQFGVDKESTALYYYQKIYGVKIDKAKFIRDPQNSRILGIADGLIGNDTGIEIKCHVGEMPLRKLPLRMLIQMAGYMYLYNRKNWILMSCTFNDQHRLSKYKVFKVNWDIVKRRWERDWYPKIIQFINEAQWQN